MTLSSGHGIAVAIRNTATVATAQALYTFPVFPHQGRREIS